MKKAKAVARRTRYVGYADWFAPIREYMARIGKAGGSAKTEAKSNASKNNGKKGGRPRVVK